MNKEELLKKLNNLPFAKEEYIVMNNASLLMQDVNTKTDDIEISISKKLKNVIRILNIHTDTDIKIVDNYESVKHVVVDHIKCESLEDILEEKKKLNLKKDQKDIKKIDLILCLKDNYRYEKELIDSKVTLIAGVDEVGRGPLVGPVVAAAVILPLNYKLEGLTDSKKLSEAKREEYYKIIMRDAISVGIGIKSEDVIDEVNIYEATKLAMIDAINNLKVKPEHILIDAMPLDIDIPTTSIIKGDIKSISISAASVIAKVTRDHMMDELDKKYPYYNFKHNKGYPTKEHIEAINKHGIIKEHRKTYAPVKEYLNKLNF